MSLQLQFKICSQVHTKLFNVVTTSSRASFRPNTPGNGEALGEQTMATMQGDSQSLLGALHCNGGRSAICWDWNFQQWGLSLKWFQKNRSDIFPGHLYWWSGFPACSMLVWLWLEGSTGFFNMVPKAFCTCPSSGDHKNETMKCCYVRTMDVPLKDTKQRKLCDAWCTHTECSEEANTRQEHCPELGAG